MTVYHVTITAPNGNKCTRPVQAACSDDAREIYCQERVGTSVEYAERAGFKITWTLPQDQVGYLKDLQR